MIQGESGRETPAAPEPTRPRRLRVLVIVSCFPPSKGGVERTSHELAAHLAELGHSVTVITTSRGREPGEYFEKMGKLKVIRFAERRFLFDAPIVPKIALTALTHDYDVLHVHGMTPSITDLAILFAKFRGKPVLLTYHNDPQMTRPSAIARLAAAIYSKIAIPIVGLADVLVSSTHSYASTSPILKHIIGRVVVIPWCVDPSRFDQEDRTEPSSSKRLLFVGQLKKYKGVDVLLESLAMLRRSGYDLHADIVGSGPQAAYLRGRADELKLDGSVQFWKELDDRALTKFYRRSDVVALPSLDRREAFGLVMLEAFAAGKPVVASNIPGLREVISMGDGYLAEPDDAGSLADSIKRALAAQSIATRPLVTAHVLRNSTLSRYDELLRLAFQRGSND